MKTENNLLYWVFVLYIFSCNTKDSSEKEFILPDSEKELLVKEFKDKLANKLDSDKNKAAVFLLNNLYHSYYESIYQSNEYYYLKDLQNGDVQYFTDNIVQSFTSYSNIRRKEVPFNLFLDYVLPHRIEAEKLENWRSHVLTDFSELKDTINHLSAKESVSKINDKPKDSFHFSSKELPSHTLNWTDLQSIGKGDCWSMAKIGLFSCRAFGLPVSIDFTPGWANIHGNHAWNNLVTSDSSGIAFMGAEANPGEYDPLALYGSFKKAAKIFRKTYSIQKNELTSSTEQSEYVPYPFSDSRIIDVTSQYVKTTEIAFDLPFPAPDSHFFYLCIYNNGNWIPVDWSQSISGSVAFESVGKDIVYILGHYQGKNLIPVSTPMLLQKDDKLHELKTNYNETIDFDIKTLQPLELDILKLANQGLEWDEFVYQIDELKKGNGRSKPETRKQYTLYYWDSSWKNHQTVTLNQELLTFENVPSNSIYKVINTSTLSSKRGTERPFVYEDSEQIWY